MDIYTLKLRKNLDLQEKIMLTNQRIKEWYNYYDGKVYVSFSGGKDSTVLLHLVRKLYPDVPAVFSNTGLEYPEIVSFVKSIDNVIIIKPKKSFLDIIKKYGYPVISKEQSQYIYQYKNTKSEKVRNLRLIGNKWGKGKISKKWHKLINSPFKVSDKCCKYLKKDPFILYEKESFRYPYIGELVDESPLRLENYLRFGCNAFDSKRPKSRPIAFWNENDIWEYIKKYNLTYSKIYDMGYDRTGCMFCGYGCHLNQPNKFQIMKNTHPKLWDYCINKLKMGEILKFLNIPFLPFGKGFGFK